MKTSITKRTKKLKKLTRKITRKIKRRFSTRASFKDPIEEIHDIEPYYLTTKGSPIRKDRASPTGIHNIFKEFLLAFFDLNCNREEFTKLINNNTFNKEFLKVIQSNIERKYGIKFHDNNNLKYNITFFLNFEAQRLCELALSLKHKRDRKRKRHEDDDEEDYE